ncbi:MAG: type IX secretion system membrane protein PorP/SprF [Robiginitalea sp.]|jgi:type IX secretion system PorP/SprF family membrane protein
MKRKLLFLFICLSVLPLARAQEDNPFIAYEVPAQNLLKFNRFLINPTFSTVREDKSYINLLHRNQAVSFDDNNQSYFLSYSGRIGDRSGLGLSLYTQREGTLSNYGVLANYAYGIKLSDKSNFTFGANLSYYNSGFDESRANPVEDDPFLSGFQDSSLLTFQPGFNISYNAFDFGMYAENLIDYNLKTSESITSFKEKTFSGHLQYTHQFENTSGIFEQGRLMPLARVRKVGEDDLVLGGNLILDLPKIGWVQGGYDSFYGASAGIGFNLNKRLSIGYTMEKGLTDTFDNFGITHEISFAYSFTPNLTEDRVMLEDGYQESLVHNEEEAPEAITMTEKDKEITELRRRLAENDAILAELMFRQDSMEQNRQQDLEKRFEMVMRMVRQETGGQRPDVEEKARKLYFMNNEKDALALQEEEEKQADAVAPVAVTPEISQPEADRRDAAVAIQESPTRTQEAARDITLLEKPVSADVATAVKHRKFRDLQDVADGYYVVANVYKGSHYMNRFMDELQARGIEASFIENPGNGLKYVYLKRFDSWGGAEEAVRSGLGGDYQGSLWVMDVENRYTNEAYAANAEKVRDRAARYDNNVLRKNVVVRDQVATSEREDNILPGSGDGTRYFLIANVFSNKKYADRFVRYLNSKGLSASYFINPENNYRYVYLKRHDNWNSALISYYSKLNDSYEDKMWIMRVTPNLIA